MDNVEQVAAPEELVSQETQSPEVVDTETTPQAAEVPVEERLRLLEEESNTAKAAAFTAYETLRKQQSNFNRKEAQTLAELEATKAKLRESLPTEDLVSDLQHENQTLRVRDLMERDLERVGREFNIDPGWLKDQNPMNPEHLRQLASLATEQRRLADERVRFKKEMDSAVKKTEEAARQAALKVRKELGVDTVANTGPISPSKSPLENWDNLTKAEKESYFDKLGKGEFHDKIWKEVTV